MMFIFDDSEICDMTTKKRDEDEYMLHKLLIKGDLRMFHLKL